ncbi:MAG: carboxypeptidase-like regulatory domain-containing protein [Bacteroidales bacterium]|nr:carboxypeptidase-like regulatory domain-containing protein [Bacteroidales bacterium]
MIKKLTLCLSLLFLLAGIMPGRAQDRDVTGTVLDETGAPVAGAYVLVKGETRGALTDADGKFSIKVKPSDTLTASFLGYEDLSIPVGEQADITFRLVPQANQL